MESKNGLILICVWLAITTSCQQLTKPVYYTFTEMQNHLETIFDLNALPDIEISVSVGEWNTLLKNFDINSRNEESIRADFSFVKDGQKTEVRDIGLRLKGNRFSRVRPEGSRGKEHDPENLGYHHASFKIDFDEFDKNKRFYSLKCLALKWFNGDPSYVREIYCLDLFRRFGVTIAPRSSYCRLTICFKGEIDPVYFGVYRMNEVIDSVYVKSRFMNNSDGFLWKCLGTASLNITNLSEKIGIESVPLKGDAFRPSYDLKTKKKDFETMAKPGLMRFVQDLNRLEGSEFKDWIATHFDVPMLLRAIAVNVAVGMWDDYWANQNNYYLYFDDTGKGWFIPYDYDNALGTSMRNDSGTFSALDWGSYMDIAYKDFHFEAEPRPLIDKILAIPEYRAMYIAILTELTDPKADYFSFTASSNRIAKWQKMVAPFVKNDTYEDVIVKDVPAIWSDCKYYRLLTGESKQTGSSATNYFKTRILSIREEIGIK